MTFTELGSPDELTTFINDNDVCIVAVSATWCGPCKRSKPELETMAKDSSIPIGYVHESDLDDDNDFFNTFQSIFLTKTISGFPTYVCFKNGGEVDRITGVQLAELKEMISKYSSG